MLLALDSILRINKNFIGNLLVKKPSNPNKKPRKKTEQLLIDYK